MWVADAFQPQVLPGAAFGACALSVAGLDEVFELGEGLWYGMGGCSSVENVLEDAEDALLLWH